MAPEQKSFAADRPLRVLVTGGAGGIGLATARAFSRTGARVQICDVDTTRLQALHEEPAGILGTQADVTDHLRLSDFSRR